MTLNEELEAVQRAGKTFDIVKIILNPAEYTAIRAQFLEIEDDSAVFPRGLWGISVEVRRNWLGPRVILRGSKDLGQQMSGAPVRAPRI